MAQAKAKKQIAPEDRLGPILHRGLREGAMILVAFFGLFMAVAQFSYHPKDPGWSYTESYQEIANAAGIVGAWYADVSLSLFGYFAYLFPMAIVYLGWSILFQRRADEPLTPLHVALKTVGFILTLAGATALLMLHVVPGAGTVPLGSGGVIGSILGENIAQVLNLSGATLLFLASFLVGLTLLTNLSWIALAQFLGAVLLKGVDRISAFVLAHYHRFKENREIARLARNERVYSEPEVKAKAKPKKAEKKSAKSRQKSRTRVEHTWDYKAPQVTISEPQQIPLLTLKQQAGLPSIDLLEPPEPSQENRSERELEELSRVIESKLLDFGVEVEVVAAHPGPVITQLELQPMPGVKASRITNLAQDLARSISARSVRVVEVIPGKSVVGLEVPNDNRAVVRLSEVLRSEQFDHTGSPLALGLGKDIRGQPVVADLARMPHLLVAGTTGSGKSVALNAMILSMLYKAHPEDARLILIDPKMLELSVYEGIPHLLTPVVTDMAEAASALRWCVFEMERRYRLMSALGVRNLAGYNKKVAEAFKKGEPLLDPTFTQLPPGEMAPELTHLPYIVVVVDELADMMMMVGKKVEELIARLAQKARAAGIHLILATQRPSVDVITGLIKSNIPTRIGFQVSSKIDSRTILDQSGAEQLLGHGDMLYLRPASMPMRVHGALVDDHEVHKVVADLRARGGPEYNEEILNQAPDAGVADIVKSVDGGGANEDLDPLYDEAVAYVTESRRASVSGVQRRFKIGYNRAARLVEQMESQGIVSPMESNGNRKVLAGPPPAID